MCGICGKVVSNQEPVSRELIKSMADCMFHRGPDREGFHVEPGVGLGFRRLAIIDLNSGDQPMSNEDGSVILVFNGEIYNFQELRPALEIAGHRFRTLSDTEVIIHAYEQYGTDFIQYLQGMFSIAIWDRNKRRLILARDRLGKKPLFYHLTRGKIIFASEIKSILRDQEVPRTISLQAVDRYLAYRYVPGNETVLKEVCRLPPAHLLVYEPDQDTIQIERYWFPLNDAPHGPVSEQQLDKLVREAVRLRLVSDVPLGAFLSGGIDSSIIVALMTSFSDRPVKTFSIGFDEDKYNELPYARMVARHYQTEHHEYVVKPEVRDDLPRLVWYADEPIGDSSALPTYYVSKMARQEVTVVLNGDGGDENFAGYRRYRSMLRTLKYMELPQPVRHYLLDTAINFLPSSIQRERLRRMTRYAGMQLEQQFAQHMTLLPASQRVSLYSNAFSEQLTFETDQYITEVFMRYKNLSPLKAITLTDLLEYLPGDLLVKMDRMSMAHSLEARSPFLDHKVVEATLTLSDADRMSWRGPSKAILRRLYGHLLPDEILKRPKSGFGVPVNNWFRGPLLETARDVLLSSQSQQRGYFNPSAVRTLIDDHAAGRCQVGDILWELVVLELWFSKFIDEVS